jgi:hypothetical protein
VVGVEDHGVPGLPDDQRTATLTVWPAALGRAGNNAPRASVACLAVVGSACPGNRRAQSCPKRGHVTNKWSSSSGVPGQKGPFGTFDHNIIKKLNATVRIYTIRKLTLST